MHTKTDEKYCKQMMGEPEHFKVGSPENISKNQCHTVKAFISVGF